ncbi:tether containing UBX domain for GLUT4 [Thalassophryne amazonica]|uniref:tether containing UBX domain for GLUT4 n=1 Tax=Thalassophryne amazonica TaxID=390379 RepID=UPI0014716C42|nr:tether containing UBX domain for GLUT4 [Thalassophryne amazonica]
MAASGASVTVLTLNGRRQVIKVCPNTPLLQVLEEVCKKYGFNPDDHSLKFQRTVVDLTLPWRFANLPNNAKLEMVPSTRKAAAANNQVRIALQMEDGSRLQGCFSCEHSLWELLIHFPDISVSALSDPESTPVCVYMRDQVSGEEALKKSTLRSLGLTGGSAIIRFLLKKSRMCAEETTEMPSWSALAVVEEGAQSVSSLLSFDPSRPQTQTSELPVENHTSPNPASDTDTLPVLEVVSPSTEPVDHPETPPTGTEMPEENVEEAGPSGLDSHSCSSAPSAPFIPFSGGGQRLGGSRGGSVACLSSSASLPAVSAAGESPKAKKAKSSHSANTKSKCQPAADQQDQNMDQGHEAFQPVERESVIYHLGSAARHREDHSEVPDEFFEVTVDDVRKRFAQLKSERRLLEEAPLMTKASREAQMKEKISKYPKVVLRVEFPDRHVLQGFFRPLETVAALRCFVKSHLADPQLDFYLFVTPPKTLLDEPSVTLFQADLFPGALVHFGSHVKFYLKRELMEQSVTASQANESIASCMLVVPDASSNSLDSQNPPPPPETTESTQESAQEVSDLPAQSAPTKPARTDPGKLPKWLKLPGDVPLHGSER